jgi:hypothetical protein
LGKQPATSAKPESICHLSIKSKPQLIRKVHYRRSANFRRTLLAQSGRELELYNFDDPVLARIIAAPRSLLREAYELCRDTSPERKITHQCACILNEFYAGVTGKSKAFRYYKIESSLVKYFHTQAQLLSSTTGASIRRTVILRGERDTIRSQRTLSSRQHCSRGV